MIKTFHKNIRKLFKRSEVMISEMLYIMSPFGMSAYLIGL